MLAVPRGGPGETFGQLDARRVVELACRALDAERACVAEPFGAPPEQRRLGIRDSYDLALQDWMGSAEFDRDEDHWPRRWAEAYVAWAAGEKREWIRAQGLKLFPIVAWAERGGSLATEHGNSVPRFHITWGTGPGVLEPFIRRVRLA